MASREIDKITSLEGANGSRVSTWNDKEIVGRWPFYATFEKAHEDVEYVPQIPEYTRIFDQRCDGLRIERKKYRKPSAQPSCGRDTTDLEKLTCC